jgi:hypothetical protein
VAAPFQVQQKLTPGARTLAQAIVPSIRRRADDPAGTVLRSAVVHRLNLLPSIATLAFRLAKHNEPGADLADSAAVVLAEIGNGLVKGSN